MMKRKKMKEKEAERKQRKRKEILQIRYREIYMTIFLQFLVTILFVTKLELLTLDPLSGDGLAMLEINIQNFNLGLITFGNCRKCMIALVIADQPLHILNPNGLNYTKKFLTYCRAND